MKIIYLLSVSLLVAACSSDNVSPVDGGNDVQNGMDATMMMDSSAMDTGQDTSMSSDAPNDNTTAKDSPSDSPADVTLDVNVGHCVNQQKDADETDVDCGGQTCAPCTSGKMCKVNTDCVSNVCKNNNTCQ